MPLYTNTAPRAGLALDGEAKLPDTQDAIQAKAGCWQRLAAAEFPPADRPARRFV